MEIPHPSHSDQDPSIPKPSQQQLLEANIELFAHPSAIPLQNRLRFLISDDRREHTTYRFTDIEEIAARNNCYAEDLIAIILDLHVPTDQLRAEGLEHLLVASTLEAVLIEELSWRKTYEDLPEEVNANEMVNIFNVGRVLINNVLDSIGIEPRRVPHGGPARYAEYYPKQLLYRVRAEIMMFPPARKNVTIHHLAKKIGSSSRWAAANIGEEFPSDLMRSSIGRVGEHFPPAAQLQLDQRHNNAPEDAGVLRNDWQIAAELDRTIEWVRYRLPKQGSGVYTNIRNGIERVEYDEQIFAVLSKKSEALRKIPLISHDEAVLKKLIEPLDTTEATAARVLRQYGFKPLKRRNARSSKEFNAYSMSIQIPLAQALIDDRLEQIADCDRIIIEIFAKPRENLSPDERKLLRDTLGVKAMATKRMLRARAAYERLIASLSENDTPE